MQVPRAAMRGTDGRVASALAYHVAMYPFHVYIMASFSRTLYTGVTNQLVKRVVEHKDGRGSEFSAKYHITRLVYVEPAPNGAHARSR